MELVGILIIYGVIIWIIIYIKNQINIYFYKLRNDEFNRKINNQYLGGVYTRRDFMTEYERYFYDIFVELEQEMNLKIVPQVNLATIVKKQVNNRHINELFRNIDFAIFDKGYNNVLLLIEINDITHNSRKRIARDIKVEKILKDADIKLIKFYSRYPNKKDYVKTRVKREIIDLSNSDI